jgi:hypothetical protein
MGVHDCRSVTDTGQKQGETQTGVLKYGFRCQTAVDEPYQYLQLFGRPGRLPAAYNQRTKKMKSQNSLFPEMQGA